MFALQAAGEKAQERMIAEDSCYFPGINALSPEHYFCHYSCDKKFDKKKWRNIDRSTFEDNLFYKRVGEWMDAFMPKHESSIPLHLSIKTYTLLRQLIDYNAQISVVRWRHREAHRCTLGI